MTRTFDSKVDTPRVSDTDGEHAAEAAEVQEAPKKTPEERAEEIRELREEMGGFEMMYVQDSTDVNMYGGLTIRTVPEPGVGLVKKVEVGAPIWVGAKRVEYKPEEGSGTYPTTFAEVIYKDPQTQELYRGWAALGVTGASGQYESYLAPEQVE